MSDLMTAYLDQLTRELSFDPSLARRMRAEAEDHLQEAVASDPMGVTTEAERRAIARFGAAREIAAQCAVPSLVKQVKNAGAAATLIAVGILIAMKSRIASYGAASQIVSDDPALEGLRTAISTIDRYAFWCGLLIAICGLPQALAPDHAGIIRCANDADIETCSPSPHSAPRPSLRRSA